MTHFFHPELLTHDTDRITSSIRSSLIKNYNLEDRMASKIALDILDIIEAADGNLGLIPTALLQ